MAADEGVWYGHSIRRQALRQQIVDAVARAQEKSPPGTGALIIESQLRIFRKCFDAIENCQQREIFDAIEAAFQLGKFVAMVDLITGKKVGQAHTAIAREELAKKRKQKGPGPVESAVRAVMAADPTITGSENHVPGIKPKIDAIVRKSVPESTIWRYTKKVAREKSRASSIRSAPTRL
jgi:hypothetical protein